jgi:DNA-binding NarL/FixJ family response regulator
VNALSLRALERLALAEHDARMSSTRGKDLPVVKRDVAEDRQHQPLTEFREACRQQTTERGERVAQLRRLGFSTEQITEQTGLTPRQIGYVEKQKRKAESSRSVVTP